MKSIPGYDALSTRVNDQKKKKKKKNFAWTNACSLCSKTSNDVLAS